MTTVYWKNEGMLSAAVEVRKWMTAAVGVRKWMTAAVEVFHFLQKYFSTVDLLNHRHMQSSMLILVVVKRDAVQLVAVIKLEELVVDIGGMLQSEFCFQ